MRKVTKENMLVGTKIQGVNKYTVIAGPDKFGNYATEGEDGMLSLCNLKDLEHFTLVPLCYVEGKPVYKGDTLYDPDGRQRAVEHVSNGALFGKENPGFTPEDWSWEPPLEEITGWLAVAQPECSGNSEMLWTSLVYKNREALTNRLTSRDLALYTIQPITLKVRKC